MIPKYIITLVGLVLASLPARSQLLFNAGDTYTYEFSTLPFFGQSSSQVGLTPSGQFTFQFDYNTYGDGDRLFIEIFEGPLGEQSIAAGVFELPNFIPNIPLGPNAWADHEGSVRLTMLSGSVILERIIVQRNDAAGPGLVDVYQSSVVPVPEPGIATLLTAGLVLIGLMWRTERSRRNNVG